MHNPITHAHVPPVDGILFHKLRTKGLRPTSARAGVLHILQNRQEQAFHAEQIFVALSGLGIRVSLGTVYRVLQELEQTGLAVRERSDAAPMAKSCFRMASKAPTPRAYSFVCPLCRRHARVEDRALIELLQRQARAAGFDAGFDANGSALVLEVTCNGCAEEGAHR